MKNIFDTHCHLNIEPYINDIDQIKKEINNSNIYLNIVGVDIESSKIAINLANNINSFASIGVHPNDCYSIDENIKNENELLNLIKTNKDKIIAIGETGLDFYRSSKEESYQIQIDSMERHIKIAEEYGLPIIFHVRDAHNEMIDFLKKRKIKTNFVIHCFSANKDIAIKYIELGGHISFSGTLTFKKSYDLVEAIKNIDINKILAETDSPFLSPEPFRGKTNNPINTEIVIEKINELLEKDVSDTIFKNSLDFFRITIK